jgi:nucleoside-diphosphate-sugar epimerase
MILVTGATSAVGTAVLKELLARKIPVRAFVRQPFVAESLEAQGVEAFLGGDTMKSGEKKPGACAIWSRSLSIGDPMREGKREDKGKEQVPA